MRRALAGPGRLAAGVLGLVLAACGGPPPPATPAPPADATTASPSEAAPAAGAAAARQSPPPPLPMGPIAFPEYAERRLANGARVIVVENHEQPIASVNLRIARGGSADPAGKTGLADFTADLLDNGTSTRSAQQIAASIDFVGGTLGASANEDWTSISASAPTEFLDTALVLMADVVLNPAFPADELEIERRRTLSGLQVELSSPESVAGRILTREVHSGHPYGALVTPETVRAIGREDLVGFHRRFYRPDQALFVVAGDVEPDEIVGRLDRHFGAWSGRAESALTPPPPAPPTVRRMVFVHQPGTVQAVVRVGQVLPPAREPVWEALDVAAQVLGDVPTGRLFRYLRDERGLAYDARASAVENRASGTFRASTESRNEVADTAVSELLRLIEELGTAPIPPQELENAKQFLAASFPLRIETPQQIGSQIATAVLLGRPVEYVKEYSQRVMALSAEDVQAAVRRFVDPGALVVVVVGDAEKIYDRVALLADSVEVVDVEGRPLTLAEVRSPPAARFDAAAITPQTLTYALLVQGNPVAEVTTVVSRETVQGRPAVKAVTTGTGLVRTQQEVAFDEEFVPLYSRSQQQAGAANVQVDLRFEEGRVRGTASGLPGGPKEFDQEVMRGTLLPGMDDYALWGAELAAGTSVQIPVFSPQSGEVNIVTASVQGEERVTTPAGEFDAYELSVRGGPVGATVWVRKQAPHIALKQEFAGQPVVLELKSLQ